MKHLIIKDCDTFVQFSHLKSAQKVYAMNLEYILVEQCPAGYLIHARHLKQPLTAHNIDDVFNFLKGL